MMAILQFGELDGKRSPRIEALLEACKRAGITYDMRMYDIRHLYISTQLTGGADLKAISEMVGHSSTKMTADVYYHCQAGEKAKAADMVQPLRPKNEKIGKVVKIP
jgi:integrase